ncbi:uncharacterized protein LOC127137175 [Lathyrus oleraceus]|uniref:uncharacterized protein LOC127137175 n=1 Tax=Pisum sativum TaxID=3888 RepID=UPI0021D13894|nr:uncharacterized protein LOC127137175 [Pisum sativum]
MFNEPISTPLSSNPSSPPYYDLTSNSYHSGSDNPDPPSPNHEDLQTTTDSEKTRSVQKPSETIPEPSEPISEPSETMHEPSEPTPQPSEPGLTLPTLDEAFSKFLENFASILKKLSDESSISDNPSEVRTHWNEFIRWVTSKVFKIKGLSEQVRNNFIRSAEEKLDARLEKEVAEKAERKVAKAVAREATDNVGAEATAREQAEAKATLAAEASHKVAEEDEKTT